MTGYGGYDPIGGPTPGAYRDPIGRPGLGGLLDDLGDRARRRAEPRFGVTLSGVGVLMIIIGVIAWAGEQAAGDGGEGESNRALGIILSLLVIAAGYLLVLRYRHGPLAAAGVAAAALGVPLLMGFVTFDATPEMDGDEFFVLPFGVDVIVLVSLVAWLVSYAWVPATRGRVFFLAASTFLLWLYVMEKVEEGASLYLVTLPYSAVFYPLFAAFEEAGTGESDVPDFTSLGGPSLIIGAGYYLVALLLDRRDHRGIATPFLAAGFVATVVGIGHLAGDLEATGTGIALILIGTALAVDGALHGRRFTTWAWAAGAGFGVLLIVGDMFEDSVAGFGGAAIVLGAGVVLAAHLVADRFTEPDEMIPGPSRFTSRPPRPPAPAAVWTGGAYSQQVPSGPHPQQVQQTQSSPWSSPAAPTYAPQAPPVPATPAPPPPAPAPPAEGPPTAPPTTPPTTPPTAPTSTPPPTTPPTTPPTAPTSTPPTEPERPAPPPPPA